MNMYKTALGVLFIVLLALTGCTRDDLTFDAPAQELRFSRDTVFCDTVYNQVRSETYAVKIYNDEDRDIMIPKITLGNGAASLYRINVDGKAGTDFTNIPLRKKDSLYVFVEIAPVANAPEAIAEDRINVQTAAGTQHITLFSVVQDAEFFIQTETNPNILADNTSWTNEKAKIIFGDLTLQKGKTLNIEKGTKVYFFKNSGLKIAESAKMNVYGELGNEVIFRGDRNDPRYDTIPKNWNGISLEKNAVLQMNYARVFGGTRGLELNHAEATIKNSIFHTHQEFGIYAINAKVQAENLVLNNCGEADFGIYKGGSYTILHSTLANYWSLNSAMPALALFATNEYNNGTSTETAPLTLEISNSIIYGKKENSIVFKLVAGQVFNYKIENSLLKYSSDAGFVFEANPNIIATIKNEDPKFINYFTAKMNLRVQPDSPARNKGNLIVASKVPLDIAAVNRTAQPTLGAYQ